MFERCYHREEAERLAATHIHIYEINLFFDLLIEAMAKKEAVFAVDEGEPPYTKEARVAYHYRLQNAARELERSLLDLAEIVCPEGLETHK